MMIAVLSESSVMMGEVKTEFTLSNLEQSKQVKVKMLVDTGAVLCLIPKEIVERLQLKSEGQVIAELADGSQKEFPKVALRLSYQEDDKPPRTAISFALVGDYGVEPLLGQVPLEQMDVLVDCKNKQLIYDPDSPLLPKYKLK